MAFVKFTGEEALGRVADYVNKKLAFASSMPESPDTNAVVMYIGATTSDYRLGSIYQFDGTNWVCINSSIMAVEITQAEYNALPQAAKLNGDIYFITDAGTDGGNEIVQGYYNPVDGKFYEESTYTTEITPSVDCIYIDLTGNKLYRYNNGTTSYVELSGGSTDNIIWGYYNTTDGKFYEDEEYTTEIIGDDEKLFITLDTNYIYRYDSIEAEFIQIGGSENTVFGYYNETDGKFYEEATFVTEIPGEANKIYIGMNTDTVYRYQVSTLLFIPIGGNAFEYVDTLPVTPDIKDKIYGVIEKEAFNLTFEDLTKTDAVVWDEDEQAYLPTRGLHGLSLDIIKFAESTNPGLGAWFITGMNSVGSILTTYASATSVVNFTTDKDIYAYYLGDEANQLFKEIVIDSSLEFLTAADIDELMSSVAQTTWSYLAEIIVDDIISTRKTWSSNKINTMLNTTLENANQYTLEQLAHFSTASYKLASSTAEVVDRDYMYLIPISGSTDGYDIYVLVDDTPTKVGTSEVNLSDYFTKDESNARFLTIADAEANYVNKVQYDREIGDVTDLSEFTATDIVGCLNEAHTFENTNVDWATEW